MEHIMEYPCAISEEKENFGRFYDESSRSISQLFQTPPKCIISANDSVISQDIVANSDSFFISSTFWQHTENYFFESIPMEGDDNVLTYYYVLRKNRENSPLATAYIEELKSMFGAL